MGIGSYGKKFNVYHFVIVREHDNITARFLCDFWRIMFSRSLSSSILINLLDNYYRSTSSSFPLVLFPSANIPSYSVYMIFSEYLILFS